MPRYLFFISSVFKIVNLKKFNFLKMGLDFLVLPLNQFIFVQKNIEFCIPKIYNHFIHIKTCSISVC